jgi:hypothetical protein
MRRKLTVRPVALQGRVTETRYRKADDGLPYSHTGDGDLWLVETADGQRGTLTLPRHGDGWERDGGTHWLTNHPKHPRTLMSTRKRSARRSARPTAARRKSKRRPPNGFKTWSAYMASIRPNGGSTMKRKRKSAPKKRRAGGRTAVVLVNRPAKRSVRHRRNPPRMRLNVGSITNTLTQGVIGGSIIVATEAGTRLIRSRVLRMSAGTLAAGLTEVGISTAAGIAAGRFLGQSTGQRIVDAGFASVIRATLKQFGHVMPGTGLVAEALGDDGSPRNFVIRNGRVFPRAPLGGYTSGGSRLSGYVPGSSGNRTTLGGYVPGASAAVASAMNNAGG